MTKLITFIGIKLEIPQIEKEDRCIHFSCNSKKLAAVVTFDENAADW